MMNWSEAVFKFGMIIRKAAIIVSVVFLIGGIIAAGIVTNETRGKLGPPPFFIAVAAAALLCFLMLSHSYIFIGLGKIAMNTEKNNEIKPSQSAHVAEAAPTGNTASVRKNEIIFGGYTQGAVGIQKQGIEWIVLEEKDGKALLLSKYALDCRKYNETKAPVTWETSTLRKWLNNEFYNSAFSDSEKGKIRTAVLTNTDNPNYGTAGGNNTLDKIFLLSLDDIKNTDYGFSRKFSDKDMARRCKPTEYAKAQGCYVNTSDSDADDCWWWLRSPGRNSRNAARVGIDGSVLNFGDNVSYDVSGVRPALWIDLES